MSVAPSGRDGSSRTVSTRPQPSAAPSCLHSHCASRHQKNGRLNVAHHPWISGRNFSSACRSLQDLVGVLSELHAVKIDLYLHQQGFDTTTPAGKAMFQMLGTFAEFERALIQERVRAGMARGSGPRGGVQIGGTCADRRCPRSGRRQ